MAINYIDILFAIGTFLFGLSSFKQLSRLYRVKKTAGFSLTGQHIKLLAIFCYLLGYGLAHLPISFVVSALESSITFITIYLICKYRQIKLFKPWEKHEPKRI